MTKHNNYPCLTKTSTGGRCMLDMGHDGACDSSVVKTRPTLHSVPRIKVVPVMEKTVIHVTITPFDLALEALPSYIQEWTVSPGTAQERFEEAVAAVELEWDTDDVGGQGALLLEAEGCRALVQMNGHLLALLRNRLKGAD